MARAYVPVRLKSSRLPNKAILPGPNGDPMFCHAVRACEMADSIETTTVVTDSDVVLKLADQLGVNCLRLSTICATGTDRVFYAYKAQADKINHDEIIVNLQADEVGLYGSDIDALVNTLETSNSVIRSRANVSTLVAYCTDPTEMDNPDVVKVAISEDRAVYFSRASIPYDHYLYDRDCSRTKHIHAYKHIGAYAFRAKTLMRFGEHPLGCLERAEGLEQLRLYDLNETITVRIIKDYDSRGCLSINSQEDYEKWLKSPS